MRSWAELIIRDSGRVKNTEDFTAELLIGILPEDEADTHAASGMSVVDLATLHEFGGGEIPARMPIRSWFDQRKNQIARRLVSAVRSVVTRRDVPGQRFAQLVQDASESMQEPIYAGDIEPENAPATLAKKDPETRPLIGTTVQLVEKYRARGRLNFGGRRQWTSK